MDLEEKKNNSISSAADPNVLLKQMMGELARGDVSPERMRELLRLINTTNEKLAQERRRQLDEKQRAQRETLANREALKKKAQEEADRLRQEEEARRLAEQDRREAEHAALVTSMELPLDWENAFEDDARVQGVHTDSIQDALLLSLSELGEADIEYISSVTGETPADVIRALRGTIYQNPETWGECFYKGWETADAYLSGNVLHKLNAAKAANKTYRGYFEANVQALERVLPASARAKEIYVTLGSPWVPPDIIDEFMLHLFGDPSANFYTPRGKAALMEALRVLHDPLTGSWEIPYKSRYRHSVAVTSTYGTRRLEALHILEDTLNMQSVSVKDEVPAPGTKSGTRRVLNHAETALALEKQKLLIRRFRAWVWKDPDRRARLEAIFEDSFGCVRRRTFNGSFLRFPGMDPSVVLYPYQKDAVWRILRTPNTLLAHDVGAGKTYVMIAAGMELRRLGRSKKNLYVVPNNIVGQWQRIFEAMYPQAKVLVVEPKTFTPDKRLGVLERIRDGEFDGIIMAYSCMELIPLSKEYYIEELERQKKELENLADKKLNATGARRHAAENIREELRRLINEAKQRPGVYFDELGITRLFLDEAHNYKNLPLSTHITKVLGLNRTGSKKCAEMLDKVHTVQRLNNGGGVVFATGTPITNSVTDVFVMQTYLQGGELSLLDLQNFDAWVGMFAEPVTDFEIDVDTSGYRLATRFSKFHNLPELTNLFAGVADFHPVDKADGIPQTDGYTDVLLPKTPELAAYLDTISFRADEVRAGHVSPKDDNMLLITTDGRKAALDLRLAKKDASFSEDSKVSRCAENVHRIWLETAERRSVQLVFCDSSTPRQGLNMYDELCRLLTARGVPEAEIAFIHSADTEAKRQTLFARARRGDIRVLIGSTFKLGLGVNVQNKLIALHHLDVPWRPADMVQREGRILRQGNENSRVQIFRYITKGSFDAYSWQLLETKQRFISALLAGSLTERSGSDIADTVLDYAQVKALAVGDPRIRRRVELANECARLITLQGRQREQRLLLEQELEEIPAQLGWLREKRDFAEADAAAYEDRLHTRRPPVTQGEKEALAARRRAVRERLFSAVRANVLQRRERELFTYEGFTLALPANMTQDKPYIVLRGKGSYFVELGESEIGALQRVDNYLAGFGKLAEGFEKSAHALEARAGEIRKELGAMPDYGEEIAALRLQIEILDKKLGVKQDE